LAPPRSRRRRAATPALLALAALAAPSPASADGESLRLGFEVLGAEIVAGGLLTSTSTDGVPSPAAEVSRFAAGPGAIVRFARSPWRTLYWTPLQVGAFAGRAGAPVRLALVQTEVGAAFLRRGRHALEGGLAAGAGVLAVEVGTGCDGACAAGGAGLMASPVIRYVHAWPGGGSAGLSLRYLVGHLSDTTSPFGTIVRRTGLVMLGVDLAFGVPRASTARSPRARRLNPDAG
jgi:hypothetical protein